MYEYKVVQVREGLIGGKMSADKIEKVLNEWAEKGWQVKSVTAAEVKGRVGPGGTEGVLVTFERQRPA
jgi:predicted rRNA methylase YqxC with S4 and FtsJ domains